MTYTTLKLTRNAALLCPKFDSYKLRNDDVLNLYRLKITHQLPKLHLPSHAKIGYYEWRARLGWNHLKPCMKPYSALYISQEGFIIELFFKKTENDVNFQEKIIANIDIPVFEYKTTGYDDIYPYFPDLKSLTETLILATDGSGKLYFIDLSSDPAKIDVATFSTDDLESHPFIILDAIFHLNTKIQVLIVHLNGKKGTSTKSKRYVVKDIMCEKMTDSWKLSVLNVFFSKEIPIFSQFLGKTLSNQTIVLGVQNRIQNNFQVDKGTLQELSKQPSYTWIQTSEEIHLFLTVSETATRQDISIEFNYYQLKASFKNKEFEYISNSKFYHTIIPSESTWTLSKTPLFSEQILEISMKKSDIGLKWPHVFQNKDDVLELEDLSHRTTVLKNLLSSKPESTASRIRSCDDDIIDYEDTEMYFLQQFKKDTCIAEISGINIVGSQFIDEKRKTHSLAVRYDVDTLIYNIKSSDEKPLMDLVHSATFPALSYISSSKGSKKYLKYSYTDKFAIIVESGAHRKDLYNSQNAYLYWNVTGNQVNSYQSVIKLEMEALGLCQVGDHDVIVLGESSEKPVVLLITNL